MHYGKKLWTTLALLRRLRHLKLNGLDVRYPISLPFYEVCTRLESLETSECRLQVDFDNELLQKGWPITTFAIQKMLISKSCSGSWIEFLNWLPDLCEFSLGLGDLTPPRSTRRVDELKRIEDLGNVVASGNLPKLKYVEMYFEDVEMTKELDDSAIRTIQNAMKKFKNQGIELRKTKTKNVTCLLHLIEQHRKTHEPW